MSDTDGFGRRQVFLEQQADVNYTAPPGGLTPLAVASLFLGSSVVQRGGDH